MKKSFITGLVIWLPIALTLMIVVFIVNFLTTPFVGFAEDVLSSMNLLSKRVLFLSQEQVLHYGSQLLILVMLFVVTVFIGLCGRWFFLHTLINLGNKILHHIPFVNTVYKTSQDVIHTIFQSQTNAFQQPVIVPFPNPNVFSLGLVTRESPPICCDSVNEQLVSVFVPTTPNPTSGYLLMLKQKDIIYIDMKIEDAIKFIISCGVIHPEDIATLRKAPEKVEEKEVAIHD